MPPLPPDAPDPDGDRELVRRTLAGDRDAFARLVDRHRAAACAAAYGFLAHPDDAQDAAQEALVQAYLRLRQLRDPEKFGPWLRRVVANVCLERLRRAAPPSLPLESADSAALTLPGPHSQANRECQEVRDALARLPEKQRLAVALHYLGGYSHAEVALHLDIPVNTVRSRLRHAKRLLREELTIMANDTIPTSHPDPDFTRRTVEKALRRADEAWRASRKGDARRLCDEALSALEAMEPDAARQRLRMEALWKKADVTSQAGGDALPLYEESLALAEALGDPEELAHRLMGFANSGKDPGAAEARLLRALALFESSGDTSGEAEACLWLGSKCVNVGRIAEGRRYYERALPLFEANANYDYAGVCRAMLLNFDQVGEDRFPLIDAWHAWCDGLDERGGAVLFGNQPGSSLTRHDADTPSGLIIGSVFSTAAPVLRTLVDAAVPAGGGWSGDCFSYSDAPLRGELKLVSDCETVQMPAGTFTDCLLAEMTLCESGEPDDAPEQSKWLNREILLGVRRAWYAPGVGLVRLHVRLDSGREATIHLVEYAVHGGANPWLPLALGNAWTYGWADLPDDWTAKEAYRVAYQNGERWHLEAWGYFYHNGRGEPGE